MNGAAAVAAAIARARRSRLSPAAPGGGPWAGYGPNPDAQLPPVDAVVIATTDDAAGIISAHPAGTTFAFATGTHRITGGLPVRAGDTFWGQADAVVNGSKLLTGAVASGSRWYYDGQTQEAWMGPGECSGGGDLCRRSDDVYFDDVPLVRVASLAEVVSGTFFFDYAADRIYIGDDPDGHVVEAAVASHAFRGAVDDVTIRNLTVEKCANAAQRGAIAAKVVASSTTYGRRWLVQDCVVRLNHGLGVNIGLDGVIVNCRVTWNGQMGLGADGGGGRVEGCEIDNNKYAAYAAGWEGGGTKFANTTGLVVRGNWVHDNYGFALWTDINNAGTLYEDNLVEDNDGVGIFHEISYSATIRNNVVRRNGRTWGLSSYGYVFGCGILAANSRDVAVYGNTVEDNVGGGICGVEQTRGTGSDGPWVLQNFDVYDNDVKLARAADRIGPGGGVGVDAHHGVYQSTGSADVFTTRGNAFTGNRYTSPDTSGSHFGWLNAQRTFTYWRDTAGQDTAGSMVAA